MKNLNILFDKTAIDKIKKDSFLRNSIIFFVGSFLASIGNYLYQFLMARMFSVKAYGELQSLLSIFVIVSIPTAALSTVLIKWTAHFKARQQMNKIYGLFSFFANKVLIISILFFIVFTLLSNYIKEFLNLNSNLPVIILGTSFLIAFLQSINRGVIQGLEKFKDASLISLTEVFFKIFLAVLLVKLGFGLNGAVGAIVLAVLIAYFISFLPIKFLFREQKKKVEINEILKYFFPVSFTLLFLTILYNMDIILVKHFFPAQVAGEYGALAILGHIVFFIVTPLIMVMFPMTAAAYSNNTDHSKILKKTIFLVSLVSFGILFFYFLFPEIIIKILIGSKFLSISKYLGWFGAAMFLCSLINLFLQYFLSIQKINCTYFVGIGAVLQIALISFWHNALWQIVLIMNVVMSLILISLTAYYLKTKNSYAEVNI